MSYFADLDSKRFSFTSRAMGLTEHTFAVMSFTGYESISKPYDFDILLVSNDKELDLASVLNSSAQFVIHRGENDDVLFNGVLSEFEQKQEFNEHVVYRARLVPKLWWLQLTQHNQVFLDETVPEIIKLGLEDADLSSADYDFLNVKESYEPLEYVCQYDETHFTFMSRWLEREGLYYYFSQEEDNERLVFSDISTVSESLPQASDLFYSPASGLESTHLSEVIRTLTCRQKQLPKEVVLKDFNYEKPSLDVSGKATVDPDGRGTSYVYGENFLTPEEGSRLAEIRAEELLCRQQEFFGESSVPFMAPGYTFNLLNHYREDYNQDYLIVEVTHRGSQTACLTPGIIGGLDNPDEKVAYMNDFKAIPSIVQYRPEKTTQRPRISGTIHAKIDAEGDGEYAELDEQGRYRVKLPFDINDQLLDGKASARVRMMQPYAGANKGMQFPLNKGTEVLLTFIDGHPDRPVIAGAVNNPETPGVVNADNQTESVIQSGSDNKIRMEDQYGSERVMVESPASNSWLRIGSTNDPITINGSSPEIVAIGSTYVDPKATALDSTTDPANPVTSAEFAAQEIKNQHGEVVASVDTTSEGTYTLKYTNDDNTSDVAYRTVVVSDTYNDLYGTMSDGIRIQSAGNVWIQAQGKLGEYTSGTPDADSMPTDLKTLRNKFGSGYDPTGLIPYADHADDNFAWGSEADDDDADGSGSTEQTSNTQTMSQAINSAHVQLTKMDTVNTQEGNIYDFGGYWNYNLGNSYAEDWINQTAKLNKKNKVLWPDLSEDSDTDDIDERTDQQRADASDAAGTTFIWLTQVVTIGGAATCVGLHAGSIGGATAVALVGSAIAALSINIVGQVMEQTKLSSDNIGDVIAGPNSGTIKSWDYKVGSSFTKIDSDDGSPDADFDYTQDFSKRVLNTDGTTDHTGHGPMHTDTTWVEKAFGDHYVFNKGNTIDINVGHKEEHQRGDSYEYRYGGRHEEVKYNGNGIKCVQEMYDKGTKTEMQWDFLSGTLKHFEYVDKGLFKFSVDLPTLPSLEIALASNSVAAKVDMSMGVNIGVKATAGMDMDISLATGLWMSFERKFGGALKMNEITGEFSFETITFKAEQEAAIKAESKAVVLDAMLTELQSKGLNLETAGLKTSSGGLDVETKGFKFS